MKPFNKLQRQQLDTHLKEISVCAVPAGGWIRAIRQALGMSVRHIGERMKPASVKQQAVTRLEANEADGSITLNSLRKAAEAMDCRFVYALIPNEGSLKDIVRKQAMKKARELVAPVNHSMVLEAQGVGNMDEKIRETAEELMQNITPRLWDK